MKQNNRVLKKVGIAKESERYECLGLQTRSKCRCSSLLTLSTLLLNTKAKSFLLSQTTPSSFNSTSIP